MTASDSGQISVVYEASPQERSSLSSFLDWWFETLDAAPLNSLFIVTLDGASEDLTDAANQVVQACNHIVEGDRQYRTVENTAISTVVFSETIFLDTESDVEAHRRYLHYYSRTLRSVQAQEKISDGLHIHFTHCSIDKEEAVVALARMINKLNESALTSFLLLSLYRHPAQGYPAVKGNIDMRILPNKTQVALVSANFHRAVRCIDALLLQKATCFLRLAIDDDDIWMPYAFQELVYLASKIMQQQGSTTRVLAIGNGLIYYPLDGGRLDSAFLSVAMNGSKAYVSASWEDIVQKSPWTLAERYATNRVGVYRKQLIDVYFTRTARPVLIYVRYGTNLTSLNKSNLYVSEKRSIQYVGGADFAIDAGIKLIEKYKRPVEPIFELDPAILRLQGSISLDGNFFEIRSNVDDFLTERGLAAKDVKLLLRWRTPEGRRARWLEVSDDWVLPYADLVRSPSIEIRDSKDVKLDKAWVRFSGTFPGGDKVSSM